MRIALLTDGITPYVTGGMQRHSANLAKYFTLSGVEVVLVHCVSDQSKMPTEDEVNRSLFEEQDNHKVFSQTCLVFPKGNKLPGHYIRSSYRYSKLLFDTVDFSEIDFVYAKGFCGWYYMEQKKKGLKLPPIGVKFHGYEMYQDSPSLKQKLQAKMLQKSVKWNNENADYIFSYGGKITEIITAQFSFPKKNIFDITSGLDESWVRISEISCSKKLRFVFVGRNERRKGLQELNHAIRKSKDKALFFFDFVGPIPEENQIELPNCKYHGALTTRGQICEVLDQADVLVCPSHSEGMPNVILEGMARGLAILATDVGAVNRVVSDSNGILIRPLTQEELNNSMSKFVAMSKDELLKKKRNSLTLIQEKFIWSKIIEQTMNDLLRVI